MDLQVAVFDVEWQGEPFALDRARKRGCDVEIERVAELVRAGCSTGFDAGGQVAGVVASKTGFAERPEQVAQGFEAEEVEALVGNFEAGLLLRISHLATHAGLL